MRHQLAEDIERWWRNLENHLSTLLEEGKIREDTTVGTLLNSVKGRCSNCGVPIAFHEDKDCEALS